MPFLQPELQNIPKAFIEYDYFWKCQILFVMLLTSICKTVKILEISSILVLRANIYAISVLGRLSINNNFFICLLPIFYLKYYCECCHLSVPYQKINHSFCLLQFPVIVFFQNLLDQGVITYTFLYSSRPISYPDSHSLPGQCNVWLFLKRPYKAARHIHPF